MLASFVFVFWRDHLWISYTDMFNVRCVVFINLHYHSLSTYYIHACYCNTSCTLCHIIWLSIASNILEQAEQLSKRYQNTTATTVDVTSEESLSGLIQNHELVIRWANQGCMEHQWTALKGYLHLHYCYLHYTCVYMMSSTMPCL